MPREYPKTRSSVEVTYTDGEVKTFVITASSQIAQYLADSAARTGMLVLRDDDAHKSVMVPIAVIRHFEVQTIADEVRPSEPQKEAT